MEITIIICLLILSIIDILYKNKDWGLIPDALATFFVIFALFLGNSIYGLIILFLFSILLYNLKFFSGFQDIKVMSGLGALITYKLDIVILVGLILLIGLLMKFCIKYINKKDYEFPFIPVFLISYLLFEVSKILI
jgi:hypothetical protein